MKYNTADFHFRGAFYFFALSTDGRIIIPDVIFLTYIYTSHEPKWKARPLQCFPSCQDVVLELPRFDMKRKQLSDVIEEEWNKIRPTGTQFLR